MNRHLNLFKYYAKEDREYQLENDLTRAFAICLQEDSLFFHEVLKEIMKSQEYYYNNLFEDYNGKSKVEIDIQKKASSINNFEHLFAVSLSGHEMNPEDFSSQDNTKEYEPICDLFIRVDNISFIFEVKPDYQDCTSQLYNQSFNACSRNTETLNKIVTPVDLNWHKLMELAVKLLNFEKSISSPSRFLTDFIKYIKIHNYKWLPDVPIMSLSPADNSDKISDRILSAIEVSKFQSLSNRFGFEFNVPWANEILFNVNNEKGDLLVTIYPGNTKGQGYFLFQNKTNSKIKNKIIILDKEYNIDIVYHIKFASYASFFTGLWFPPEKLKKELYTYDNFEKTGRKKRGNNNWKEVENLFNEHFIEEYNWKEECQWDEEVVNSGKTQFDLSFGYELSITIPFNQLQEYDKIKDDLTKLTELLNEIYNAFKNILE